MFLYSGVLSTVAVARRGCLGKDHKESKGGGESCFSVEIFLARYVCMFIFFSACLSCVHFFLV